MESSGTTNRWVSGPRDARLGAYVLYATAARQPRAWVVAVALLLFTTGVVTRHASPRAIVVGCVYTLLCLVAVYGGSYLGVRRRMDQRLPPGLALESEFGDDAVVVRSPSAESKLEFRSIDRVRRIGDWVLLRRRRGRSWTCWPAALFPPDDLVRRQRAVAGGRDA